MNDDAEKAPFRAIEVNIFNQIYSLRTNRDAEHVQHIARLLDERMRLVSANTATHDLAKIAIFAALNIADELRETKDYYEREFQALLSRANEQDEAAQQIEETKPTVERETLNNRDAEEPQSWFEAIFDAPDTPKERGERLSSKVAAKLHSLRQTPQETPLTIEEDD